MKELLEYLITTFGVCHDVRFVPSVIVGTTDYMYRVTVSNLRSYRDYSVKGFSYEESCEEILREIKNDVEGV
jgi:hypothetical protein